MHGDKIFEFGSHKNKFGDSNEYIYMFGMSSHLFASLSHVIFLCCPVIIILKYAG